MTDVIDSIFLHRVYPIYFLQVGLFVSLENTDTGNPSFTSARSPRLLLTMGCIYRSAANLIFTTNSV